MAGKKRIVNLVNDKQLPGQAVYRDWKGGVSAAIYAMIVFGSMGLLFLEKPKLLEPDNYFRDTPSDIACAIILKIA